MKIPDNLDAFNAWEDEITSRYRNREICVCCGERIKSEYAYDINGLYCQGCFDEYVSNIREYMED